MVTIPARIVECECGKLITLDALTIGGVTCPTCNKKHNPTQSQYSTGAGDYTQSKTPLAYAKYPEHDN